MKIKKIKLNSGASLPEVAVALVIITVIIIVMVSTFSFSQITLMKQGMRRAALHLAKSELEKELGNSWGGVLVGTRTATVNVGEARYELSCDIGEYTYSFGDEMSKVTGSPAALPDKITGVPFGSGWNKTIDTITFKLVRVTVTYGPHRDTAYLQQLIAENWRI